VKKAWRTHRWQSFGTHPNLADYSELFLFTELQPDTAPPRMFFFGPVWHQPHINAPVRLIDAPAKPPESGVVFSTV
jgi:hypothetical protein